MRVIRLPNGNLLVPVEPEDSDGGPGLAEVSPDDEAYGKWLPYAEDGEDPRLPRPGPGG